MCLHSHRVEFEHLNQAKPNKLQLELPIQAALGSYFEGPSTATPLRNVAPNVA